MKKNCKKQIRIEKVLKTKSDKLYPKWKGYDNSFNSWINKNDLCVKMSQYFLKSL